MIRRFAMMLVFTVLVIGFIITGMWVKFLYTPVITDETGYVYTVQPGASVASVTEDLYFNNVISNRLFFKLLIRWHGYTKGLKAAEYRFSKGSTPSSILTQMYTGRGVVYHAFTLIPGWTFKDLRAAMGEDHSLQNTSYNLTDSEVMARLGFPELNPEGQFYPDTYYFTAGSNDLSILKRALMIMQNKLAMEWLKRAPDLQLKTAEEALIVASLIEKEAYLNSERPLIASVIMNRLRKNMLLQIDPTVIYGLGAQYTGKLHKDDLSFHSPYNTYINKGLPPTPIAMPSLASLMAALHPADTDYLYFVARGDGSHKFSTNLNDHNAAVFSANHIPYEFFNVTLLKNYLQKVFI